MRVIGTLPFRCKVCSAKFPQIHVRDEFSGVVVVCGACRHEDFIGNPFMHTEMLLEFPPNWYLVHNEPLNLVVK